MGLSPVLPPAVLDALRSATLSGDGLTLTLTGQLDADTYRRVKKALDTYGGKWNRKAGTHDFAKDFRPHLAHLLAGGKVGADNGGKNPFAFFPTPEPVIQEMCRRIWPWPNGSRFLEPSAGEGVIADFLWNRHSVYADCVELDETRAQVIRQKGYRVVGSDFLSFTPEQPYDYVLMNPPFTVDGDTQAYIAHIEHALTCLRPGGDLVAVVPGSFAWLSRKRVAEFRAFCEKHAQSPLQEIAPGAFKASGTDIATCLIHVTKPQEAEMPSTTKKTAPKTESPDFAAIAQATREKMAEKNAQSKTRRLSPDLQPEFQPGDLVTVTGSAFRDGAPLPGVIDGAMTPPEWLTAAKQKKLGLDEIEYGVDLGPDFTDDDGCTVYLFRAAFLSRREPEGLASAPAPTHADTAPAPILVGDSIRTIALRTLHPSPLNPRKVFEQAALEELAESILHKGLMQNLVIRPVREGDSGHYEVVAGGRRLRALQLLAEQGRIPDSYMVPVRVQQLSDLEALQLATAENVERRNMSPIEEADAFAGMVALGATSHDIALRFGFSDRTVQQRLVLAEGLGEDGRKLFSEGKIGLGQAQVIAQTSGPLRKHVVQAAASGSNVARLQHLIETSSFLVAHAKFDVSASGLEIVEDLYGDQPARFADPKAALAKQLDWVQARAKELEGKKEQHFVDVLKRDSDYLSLPYDTYTTYGAPKSIFGAVILVSTVTGEVQESRTARTADIKSARAKEQAAERKQASSEATGSDGAAIRNQGWIDGHEARATALRSALVGDHKRAVALTILMMLEAEPVTLRASLNHVQPVTIPAGLQRLRQIDEKLGGELGVSDVPAPLNPLAVRFTYGDEGEVRAREYLELLLTLSLEELLDLQSVLIAQAVGGWSPYNPVHAPRPFMAQLAADTGAVVKFKLTDEHLKAYPRDRLLELAADAGLTYIAGNTANLSTNKDIRAAILEYADALYQRGYVPPLARFPEAQAVPVGLQVVQDLDDGDTPFPVSAD